MLTYSPGYNHALDTVEAHTCQTLSEPSKADIFLVRGLSGRQILFDRWDLQTMRNSGKIIQ